MKSSPWHSDSHGRKTGSLVHGTGETHARVQSMTKYNTSGSLDMGLGAYYTKIEQDSTISSKFSVLMI